MDSVTVIRPLVLKIKVTESFKSEMLDQLQKAIQKVEAELQHLNFQSKRMVAELEKQNPAGIPSAKEHLEKERQKRLENQKNLREKMKYIESLAIGSEITHGTMDSLADIKIGDDMRDLLSLEVVVCDNKVVEIRGGRQ